MEFDPSTLPAVCGVYLFKGKAGKVLYVGKAIDIRARVRSHLQDQRSEKEKKLRELSESLDWIATTSELEALVLEDTLIKRYKPKFNIRLKDDKSYPYLLLTDEIFPAVHQVRGLNHGPGDYFGPHSDPRAVRRSLRWLRKLFPVRSCLRDMSRPSRPCLEFHLARCMAPCSGEVKGDNYDVVVSGLRKFLSGSREELISAMEREMWNYSSIEDYEKAALARDILSGLRRIRQTQRVLIVEGGDIDALFIDGEAMIGTVVKVRDGRVVDVVSFSLEGDAPSSDPTEDFISSFYAISGYVPPRIIVSGLRMQKAEQEELEHFLSSKGKIKVKVMRPRGEQHRSLIDMAKRNSSLYLEKLRREAQGAPVLVHLKEQIGLRATPEIIEGFDVSHLHGSGTVASMVQFKGGRPNKSGYRRFRIRSVQNDDTAAIKEAVMRRYSRLSDEGREMPDLILIDGGKGQLSSAVRALKEIGISGDIDVISIAKREEELFRPERQLPIRLKRTDPGLMLLQRVRDEAHRFAVSYQRKVREKDLSFLTSIEGIGEARARKILLEFRDMRELIDAGPEGVRRRCSIPPKVAERLVIEVAINLTYSGK
ncbi:MAG: excinuclease ABC subunit UvrC [Thermoplasmatota archaeon]